MTQSETDRYQDRPLSRAACVSRLHILALVTEAYGGHGGIAKFNRDLLEALSDQSEVRILPRLAEQFHVIPKHVPQLPPARNKIDYALRALTERCWIKGGLVFCGHINLLPVAWLMKKATGTPIWLHIHGIEAWTAPSAMTQYMLRSVDRLTSASRITRERFLTWAPVSGQNVGILHPSVDLDVFTPGSKSEELVKQWGLEGKKVLLTVGRLSSAERYKGHDRIICALPLIAETIPEVVYVIVGDGDDRHRLEILAWERNVQDRVIFVGGIDENPEEHRPSALIDWYRTADVFVMPSTGEGFGIVFIEALACGLPVVAGDRDGSRDALSDGDWGALIDPDNRNQIVKAVLNAFHRYVPREVLTSVSKDQFRDRIGRMLRPAQADSGAKIIK